MNMLLKQGNYIIHFLKKDFFFLMTHDVYLVCFPCTDNINGKFCPL